MNKYAVFSRIAQSQYRKEKACTFKKRYDTEAEAKQGVGRHEQVYACMGCGGFHRSSGGTRYMRMRCTGRYSPRP